MSRIIDAVKDFFQPLSGAQRTLFGLLSIGVIMLVGLLFYWALQPNYAVLFQSLSAESAQTIVEELQATNVDYQLGDNGKTIRVPREQVYDLRLKFAANGAAGDNYQGYELFDQNALGMTDFMQQVNKKRALEGELARTINSLKQVESSRIHIVLPERSPFQENTVKPSASIVVRLKPNRSLDEQQIEGITALIAGSIENLTAKEVVILDQKGNKISSNSAQSDLAAATSEQMRIRESAERYLRHKGQSMLDRVVGPGNSILRVSTEHNFNKIVSQSNTIIPESQTVISEETRTLQNTNRSEETGRVQQQVQSTSNAQNQSEVEVTNYEISKVNKRMENMVGEIRRISASVLLNYQPKVTETKNGETKTTFEPYTEQELSEIKQVMRAALGINDQRGDKLTITQIKFQDPYSLSPETNSFFTDSLSIYEMIRLGLLVIIASVIGFLMYRTSKNMGESGFDMNRLMGTTAGADGMDSGKYLEGQTEESGEDEDDIYAQKLSDEAREQLEAASSESKSIDQFVDQETSQAANLVRTLMKQE